MSRFVVYVVWDLAQNQPFYVGKAASVVEREKQHIKAADLKKNGPAFFEETSKNARQQ